jgi:exonuclease VII large subunit
MHDLVKELIDLLARERRTLDALRERLRSERRAFIAARSNTLDQATMTLGAAAEQRARDSSELLRAFARLAEHAGVDLSVATVGLVARRLPRESAARLLEAAAGARRAAEATRVELAVGERLLAFAGDFKESIMRSVLGAVPGGPPVYGRSGRPAEEGGRPTLSLMDARC